MTSQEKRMAVLSSAMREVEAKELAGKQIVYTVELAKLINKFMDKKNAEMEVVALALDGLVESLCVAVYDEAKMGKRVVSEAVQ